jgi:hypothetical protein
MAYTVTTTAGVTIATVADGTVNTSSTSLTLIGKNYAGYGIFLNENYIQILENFSNSTPPSAPLTGQLWYDNVNDILKVYNSDSNIWKPISSSISQATAPSSSTSVTGDIWWDTTNAQLKVWSGSAWITIGPSYTTTAGTSGAVVESILDNSTPTPLPHVVVKFYISSSVIALLSKDATFTPQTAIPGFSSIVPGLNLISSATLTGAQFTGTTSATTTLGGYTASQFLKSGEPTTASGYLTAAGGLTVGSDLLFDASSGTVAAIKETTSNKNIRFDVIQSGNPATILTLTASSLTASFANVTVAGTTALTGTLTTAGTILPSGTVDIGASGNKFANVYANYLVGTSISAQYADLAERFEADVPMVPGTVVELGGVKEITAAVQELSEAVFGVISTLPGFLLNGSAGTNATHPAIAVNGRVPVRVIGQVKKGDRLVSAGNGLARAGHRDEITAFNVIGRALADKTTDSEGAVEAIVKLNS